MSRPAYIRTFVFLGCSLLGVTGTCVQARVDKVPIEAGPNLRISPAGSETPYVEPHAAVNPENLKNLIVASIVVRGERGNQPQLSCEVFSSFDGGQSWTRKEFQAIVQAQFCADPWVAFGTRNRAYVAFLLNDQSIFGPRAGIVVFSSPDGGQTWSEEPVKIPFGQAGSYDRQTMVVDTAGRPPTETVYVVASQSLPSEEGVSQSLISVSRSTDSGKTFSEPVHVRPERLEMGSTGVEILSDGTLAVLMASFKLVVGDERTEPVLEGKPRSWLLVSDDGGKTFQKPHLIGESFLGPALLAVDETEGPFRDNLYAVGTPRRTREKKVLFARSTDRGKTWTGYRRIDSGPGTETVRDAPMIAVNQDGVVGIAWYDQRDDPDHRCNHIYFTASLDGGESFLPEVRISTEPSCPLTAKNGFAGRRWQQGGDYSGMVAGTGGRFHVVWADARSGVYQLYTAAVTVRRPGEPSP